MTANQLAYWSNVETKRSNLARESETSRHNVAYEKETNRHNLETESQGRQALNETARSNRANESIRNRANDISYYDALTKRQNVSLGYANLAETRRHNTQQEKLGVAQHNLSADRLAFDYHALDRNMNRYNLDRLETKRHNLETESNWNASLGKDYILGGANLLLGRGALTRGGY